MSMEELLHQIIEKEAKIGIIGLGYTGLGLAHDFGNAGFQVIGFDTDANKIHKLQNHENYVAGLALENLFPLLDAGFFNATSNDEALSQADVLIISVPTPLNAKREPDISCVEKAGQTVAGVLKKKGLIGAAHGSYRPSFSEYEKEPQEKSTLIVLQSTTYPGTTEEVLLPLLEKETGLKVGSDFFLAHVPEREDAGNPVAILSQIPRICGGVTRKCLFLAKALYENITVKVHPCSSPRIAEAAKSYENTFRLINIAFVDEMKMAFDKMNIDIWEVIEAASTKPFGFTAFYPGPGIGGECIPVDPLYLAWRAKKFNAQTTMIDRASDINLKISEYVVQKTEEALKKLNKNIQNAKILLLGVAFKKDVGDIRESPSLRVIQLLREKGSQLSYHDFFVPNINGLQSIQLTEQALADADCVIILTDHSQYNWNSICQNSALIVDTRNATKKVRWKYQSKIVL